MSDAGEVIQLIQGRRLSVDQAMALFVSGALPVLPGTGRRVLIIGSLPPYSDEHATFPDDLAAMLVAQGRAAYA